MRRLHAEVLSIKIGLPADIAKLMSTEACYMIASLVFLNNHATLRTSPEFIFSLENFGNQSVAFSIMGKL
jgi:hypothetical protein